MTKVKGVNLWAAPCCGARYKSPRLTFLNYRADAYWTDGWRENSLMPNDGGLRRCQCGKFVLLRELISLGHSESSELPYMELVESKDIELCLFQSGSLVFEQVVRRLYWQDLNHAYRKVYIAFRAEVAAQDVIAGTFSVPPFEPTLEQQQNMISLSGLMNDERQIGTPTDLLDLTELYREMGEFDQARKVLKHLRPIDRGTTSELIEEMIKLEQTAPIRYRM